MAPENPFPKPTEECYILTKYVLESKNEFGNTNKVILAGDSAGGNCVAVMTQRLKVEKVKQPILQVLIYPWTQLVRLLYIYSFFYQVADNLNFKEKWILKFLVDEFLALNNFINKLNSKIKANVYLLGRQYHNKP